MTLREARHACSFAEQDNQAGYNEYLDCVAHRRQARGLALNGLDDQQVRDNAWEYARAPPGERPANQQPHNRGPLPGRTYEAEAFVARVVELMDENGVGRARRTVIGVAVRDTKASPKAVVAFSGSQDKVERIWNRGGPGRIILRERLENARFVMAPSEENVLQYHPGFEPVPGGAPNVNCAAPRCLRRARFRGKAVLGLVENWRSNAADPNQYRIPDHPDENAMYHCPQCDLNSSIM
jgi:hypothetical protein